MAADAGGTDVDAVTAALGRVPAARCELDRVEAGLIADARSAGLSWRQVAAALGLGTAQAAEQRAIRLGAATTGHGNRDVAARRRDRARANTPTQTPTSSTDKHQRLTAIRPVPAPAVPAPVPAPGVAQRSHSQDANPEGVNAALKNSADDALTRAVRSRRSGRDTPLTTPGVTHAARRRRVTAADFDADPLYDLVRGPSPGGWQVTTRGGEVLGNVYRHGRSRWAGWTPTGLRVGTRSHPSRAEAAFEIVVHHDTHTSRARTARRRGHRA